MAQLVAIGLTAIAIQPIIAFAPGSLIGAIAPVSLRVVLHRFWPLDANTGMRVWNPSQCRFRECNRIDCFTAILRGKFSRNIARADAIEMTPHIPVNLTESLVSAAVLL